ncbi:MAG TPA: FG-GAP repeat protein, partial [Pyrinomonadaceae bacterium]|nr:FG-GAP repeat protein [Pyrinomonadaceae bacterium]
MKRLIYALSIIIFTYFTVVAQQLPTLRGEEAIESLKQNGQYDSLMKAVKSARKESGQTENSVTENPVGEWAKLTPSGYSVAISGETVIIGGNESAYVFVRSGTTWIQQQKLTASDGVAGDQFGISVSISGNTVIVGAWSDDIGTNQNQGSAYVFVRSGATWTEQQKLTASDGAAGDFFGARAAISGDTIIVSATHDDVGDNINQGSVYVFVRSGTTWTQQQKLTASDGAANDQFGSGVSISGDTAVVGAERDDIGTKFDQGSAYVFVRSGAIWTEQQKLIASEGWTAGYFGRSVAISGDTVIIGNPSDGWAYAYVFVRSGAMWTQKQRLNASDSRFNDHIGNSVAISGSSIIISPGYIFRFLSNNWTQESVEVAEDSAAGDNFGYSVAISGDTAIVGAYKDDVGANTDQGSAYVFVHSSSGWTQQAQLNPFPSEAAPNDYFGSSVAIFGNWVIVGSPGDDVGDNIDQGSAYIYQRIGSTWTSGRKIIASDGAAGDHFGSSVSFTVSTQELAIIGAPGDDIGAKADQGSAYIFIPQSSLGWIEQQKLTASDGAAGDHFGYSVSLSVSTAIV